MQPTTSSDTNQRNGIPKAVLRAAGIPCAPEEDVSLSELVNLVGVSVDFFVSHAWKHGFAETVQSIMNFAKSVYLLIGKESPDAVTLWICTFVLNQHRAKDEVGVTP